MTVNDSREVVIEAEPEEILAVIADVESAHTWSPQYQSAEVLEAYDDGRPKRVRMKVKAAGQNASLNLLWAMEGALTGQHWQLVARDERTRLLLELDAAEEAAREAMRR